MMKRDERVHAVTSASRLDKYKNSWKREMPRLVSQELRYVSEQKLSFFQLIMIGCDHLPCTLIVMIKCQITSALRGFSPESRSSMKCCVGPSDGNGDQEKEVASRCVRGCSSRFSVSGLQVKRHACLCDCVELCKLLQLHGRSRKIRMHKNQDRKWQHCLKFTEGHLNIAADWTV